MNSENPYYYYTEQSYSWNFSSARRSWGYHLCRARYTHWAFSRNNRHHGRWASRSPWYNSGASSFFNHRPNCGQLSSRKCKLGFNSILIVKSILRNAESVRANKALNLMAKAFGVFFCSYHPQFSVYRMWLPSHNKTKHDARFIITFDWTRSTPPLIIEHGRRGGVLTRTLSAILKMNETKV
jgi:hypothetical protein